MLKKLTKKKKIKIKYRFSPDFRSVLRCNYSCSYCFININKNKRTSFTNLHFNLAKLIWDKLALLDDEISVKIQFDGEIFIDKWATKIAYYISNIQNVKLLQFVTNNSINPKQYMHNLDPLKCVFNCSYHPEMLNIKKFIEHIYILRKNGYKAWASLVCTPEIIKHLPKIHNLFKRNGIVIKLSGFTTHGSKYFGKRYPRDFSVSERKLLKKYYDIKELYDFLIEKKETAGLMCNAGVDTLVLYLNGLVRRCNSGSIGNYYKNKQSGLNTIFTNFKKPFINPYLSISPLLRRFNPLTFNFHKKSESTIFKLLDGRIKMNRKAYSCNNLNCLCPPDLTQLELLRNKYDFMENSLDVIDLNTIS